MRRHHFIKYIRILILLLALLTCFLWLISSSDLFRTFYFQTKDPDPIEYYDDFQDIHVYPPPWLSSNWTMHDYFARKDRLKAIADQQVIDRKQKTVIKNGFLNRERNQTRNNEATYVIVEFTQVFRAPKFCDKSQEFVFGKQCPYHNCKYTCERNLSEKADVLLMHYDDIRRELVPVKRHPDQIWLFWQDEPIGAHRRFNSYQFNWTITYRFNAEASLAAYGLTILRKRPLSMQQLNFYIDEAFNKRESRAIWFVSNCKSKRRLDYYHRLRLDYPSITAYGRCVSSSSNATSACARDSECESSNLLSKKFYLAFESQSCRDYTTEKFWRSLSFGAVPIVFGPRTKQSLEQIAPPNSFIFTGDFHSTSELADHLHQIAKNRTLFGKYHSWRRFYIVLYQAHEIESYRFCELCYRLNTNRDRIYYQDLYSFFLDEC